jgi:SOS-response transcriptional repressor LexA
MTINDRLRLLRDDLSYREFARRLDRPLNTIRRYELGLVRIPADYVQAVCHAFSVPADWLLLGIEAGTDDVIRSGKAQALSTNGKRYVMIAGEKVCIVCVPVLNMTPAGPWTDMADDTPVGTGQYGQVWIPDVGDENAFALKAWGDSMDPVIRDGDNFVVSPRRRFDFTRGLAAVRIRELPIEEFGAACGEVCVKYVQSDPDCVSLVSVNSAYPTVSVSPRRVDILGQVYPLRDTLHHCPQ